MTVQLLKMRSTSSDRPCSNVGSMLEVCKTIGFTEESALDRGEVRKANRFTRENQLDRDGKAT